MDELPLAHPYRVKGAALPGQLSPGLLLEQGRTAQQPGRNVYLRGHTDETAEDVLADLAGEAPREETHDRR